MYPAERCTHIFVVRVEGVPHGGDNLADLAEAGARVLAFDGRLRVAEEQRVRRHRSVNDRQTRVRSAGRGRCRSDGQIGERADLGSGRRGSNGLTWGGADAGQMGLRGEEADLGRGSCGSDELTWREGGAGQMA